MAQRLALLLWSHDQPGSQYTASYHVTDLQFSSVAMVKANGTLIERDSYDAYGNATHRWAGDLDGDGLVDSADDALLTARPE